MSAAATLPVNHWPQNKCAKAFWSQRDLPAYRQLFNDTVEWLDPQPGQRWIDLGCGGGQLTRALWEKSGGSLDEVIALDCAQANEKAIDNLCRQMTPLALDGRVRFLHADFSHGLSQFDEDSLDGATSGLAIQYAEYYDPVTRRWTTQAYDQLLCDVCRVLKPGGVFVFSVNPPEPSWTWVALTSVFGVFLAPRKFLFLKNVGRLWRYGSWLKQQARTGRFHYLSSPTVTRKLMDAGFERIEHRLSFSRQAYLFRCYKPA